MDIYLKILLIITILCMVYLCIEFIITIDRKNTSEKYCNFCVLSFESKATYCSNCGKKLDEFCDCLFDNIVGSDLRSVIYCFDSLFKRRDIVTFIDRDSNYDDLSICLKNKVDRGYLKELQNNVKFLNMLIDDYKLKRVRDGFLKSHLEVKVIYSSNSYVDYGVECLNGGIEHD